MSAIWTPPLPEPPSPRETTKFIGPKVLIAVKSCIKAWMMDEHEVIRNTWGKHVPKNVDLIFFMGNGAGWLLGPGHDEVILNVPDDYHSLPKKTKAIAYYAFNKRYDFVYFCDNDTFVDPKALLESGFQKYDYSGHFWTFDGKNEYFHGGYGYILGKKGLKAIANSEVGDVKFEDGWVGSKFNDWDKFKVGTLPKFSWHFPKDHYPSPKYSAKFPWQEMMTQYHIRKERVEDRIWKVPISGFDRAVQFNLHHTDKE